MRSREDLPTSVESDLSRRGTAPGHKRRWLAIAGLLPCVAVGALTLATTSAQASQGGQALLPTLWDCANGDTVTFNLPAVAYSPGQGAISAPFPGFLVEESGPVAMPTGTYQVLSIVPGKKTGLQSGAVVCWPDGLPQFALSIAPAAH